MQTADYKNRKLEFEESAQPKLLIDGERVQVSYDAAAKTFNAGELPYQTFTTVRALAEAVVQRRQGGN